MAKYTNEEKYKFIEEFKAKTQDFAIAILEFCDTMPYNQNSTRIISNQLGRSCTSTAANYRAACRARSGREFYAKINITDEEADETVYWLEILKKGNFKVDKTNIDSFISTATQILGVVSKAKQNSKYYLVN
jgi:four helix bundle protein